MSLTLIVRSGGSPSLTFDGARVVIGRGSGCDVRLPDPSVSHRHASIRIDAAEHALVDEGSSNGTFVGGVRLAPQTPRALKTGDMIRVGRVWIEVRIDQRPPTRDLALATKDLAMALVAEAMQSLGDDTVPKVRVVEGPDLGAVLALREEGRIYLLGRGETCDLALADPDASREHVQLVRRGSVVLVRDLDSKNGAVLGEAAMNPTRDVAWRSTLMLRAGRTVLALEEPVALALAELEAGADEPVAAEDVPPPPPPSAAKLPQEDLLAPPASEATNAPAHDAPIARVDNTTSPPAMRRKRKSAWSTTDLAVVLAAVAIIALSAAGLYWLLRR